MFEDAKWYSEAPNGRTDYTMAKRKRKNNYLQYTAQKTRMNKANRGVPWRCKRFLFH